MPDTGLRIRDLGNQGCLVRQIIRNTVNHNLGVEQAENGETDNRDDDKERDKDDKDDNDNDKGETSKKLAITIELAEQKQNKKNHTKFKQIVNGYHEENKSRDSKKLSNALFRQELDKYNLERMSVSSLLI